MLQSLPNVFVRLFFSMCGINDCFAPSGLKYFLHDPQGVALGYHITSLWDFANAYYYRVAVNLPLLLQFYAIAVLIVRATS